MWWIASGALIAIVFRWLGWSEASTDQGVARGAMLGAGTWVMMEAEQRGWFGLSKRQLEERRRVLAAEREEIVRGSSAK
jgi:hypothetical protein